MLRARDGQAVIERAGETEVRHEPFVDALRRVMAEYRSPVVPDLPRLTGGAVGFFGYDAAPWFEPALDGVWERERSARRSGRRSGVHAVRHGARLRSRAAPHPADRQRARHAGREPRVALPVRVRAHRVPRARAGRRPVAGDHRRRRRRRSSRSRTSRARSSRRRCAPPRSTSRPATSTRWCCRSASTCDVDRRPVHRVSRAAAREPVALHVLPARSATSSIVGSSPEMLVRVEGRHVETHPIAGTRPRGATTEEDLRLGEELKRDEKERAEHVMLVDLGRNDVGRVCDYGTVRVPQYMTIERYSHVMHLVSRVEGRLADGQGSPRRAGRLLPGRDRVGRAEDPRHGDHRGARAVAARRLRRRGGLSRFRRQPRLLHRHPHAGAARRRAPRCRRAPASSPIPTRRPSTKRPATRRRRSCAPSSSRSGSCGDGPPDRQLRFVHVQPRAVLWASWAPRCRCAATTRSRSTRSRR